MKVLRRFSKTYLEPGVSIEFRYRLNKVDFSFVGKDLERYVEPGRMAVIAGGLQKEFYIKAD
jgi:hypothetical protein